MEHLRLSDFEYLEETILFNGSLLPKKDRKLVTSNKEANKLILLNDILNVINLYGKEGLTMEEIRVLTQHSKKSIRNALSILYFTKKIYKVKRKRNLVLYYPYNTIESKQLINNGIPEFEVSLVYDADGKKYIRLTQKEYNLFDGCEDVGAVVIPVDRLEEIVNLLRSKNKIKN